MNERDKKIRIGLTVFFCSITLITLIKGTYAYPSTMENNNSNGSIVPLGGDGSETKCWYCESNGEYRYQGSVEYTPVDSCASGWTSCPASDPTPTPTKTSTPTPTPTKIPTPTSTTIIINPDPSPVETASCYVCSTDDNNFYWGLIKPRDGYNSCNGSWRETNKSYDECKPVETPIKENACYVCSTDSNNFYWGLDKPEDGTNSCDSSWNVTRNSYSECKPSMEPISNPNTGDIMLYIAYMVAISAFVYSGLNFYKYKKNVKK